MLGHCRGHPGWSGLVAAVLLAAAVIVGPSRFVSADPPPATPPANPFAGPPFASEGLTRSGPFLVLADAEADVRARLVAFRAAKSKVAQEASARRDFERRRREAAAALDDLDAQFADVNAQRLAAKPDTHEWDRLGARNNLLIVQRKRAAAALAAIDQQRPKLADTQSDYLRLGVEACDAVDRVAAQYAELAADAKLAAALRRANDGVPPARAVRLGPSPGFTSDQKFLAPLRAELLTAPVAVTHDGGVPTVDVVLNGRSHVRMIWDSGATDVCLSADAAAAAGLRPTASDRVVQSQIANGQHVTSHVMVLKTVQVGAFVAHDVECEVSPPGEDAPLLLGDSFQSRFLCRMDQAAGKLYLSPLKVAADDSSKGPSGPALPPARPAPLPGGLLPGLVAQLYADPEFHSLAKTRVDRQLYFEWRKLSPDPVIPGDRYSVRWTGVLRVPQSGTYQFEYSVDDTVRVRIDNAVALEQLDPIDPPRTADVRLSAGVHPIVVEYRNKLGEGHLLLRWALKGGFPMQQLQPGVLAHRPADEPAGTDPAEPGWLTDYVGPHDGGDPFRDDAPPGAVLVGLALTDADFWGHRVVRSLVPVYRGPTGVTNGRTYGEPADHAELVLAKPGYALTTVAVRAGDRIDSLTLRFARLNPDGACSPTDAYIAPTYGGDTRGAVPLGDPAKPLVGVYGVAGKDLNSIGFVRRD